MRSELPALARQFEIFLATTLTPELGPTRGEGPDDIRHNTFNRLSYEAANAEYRGPHTTI